MTLKIDGGFTPGPDPSAGGVTAGRHAARASASRARAARTSWESVAMS